MKCGALAIAVLLVGSAGVFFIIGALGPPATEVHHHPMYMCLLPNANRATRDLKYEPVDDEACSKNGHQIDMEMSTGLWAYEPKNVIFYAQIPYKKKHVMTRYFHFLLADLGIRFSSSDYSRKLMDHKLNTINFEVALGYRDSTSGPWSRLVQGNMTRTMKCTQAAWSQSYYRCNHVPFFELGSCHHKQYVVNLWIPTLPMGSIPEYSGLAPISKLTIYVIFQTIGFTKLWLALKSILCPLTALVVAWFLRRMASPHQPPSPLIEKVLACLGLCLVLYNAPLEWVTLYFDLPWILVVNDFRQGLFIGALFAFWVIFIGEHSVELGAQSHISHYWKQMGLVALSSVFLFVYEFCERGIQVIFPFYSLWSNWLSTSIAYVFIGIAGASALLYVLTLASMLVRAYRNLRERKENLTQMSTAARERFESIFYQWKFFLVVTVVIAVVSVGTVVLPSELLLHQWQQGVGGYSIYSALLTGNYGLWNAYAVIMMLLYAPLRHDSVEADSSAGASTTLHDIAAVQKIMSKQSQE